MPAALVTPPLAELDRNRRSAPQRPVRLGKARDPLLRLAASYERRFRDTFLASVARLRRKITVAMVEEDMRAPDDPRNLFELLDGLEIAKAEESVFASILVDSAKLELGGRTLREAMTVQSPFVQQAAQTLTANMVVGVTSETKKAIRAIIFEAIRDGDAPAVAQKSIRRIVGLTRRDALAVQRVAAARMAAANTAIQRAAAQRGIDAYSAKLLRGRAMNIARTETIRAGNAGRVMGWKAMADQGLIDRSRFRQRWVVTGDDRLCDRCAPMSGKLVSLGGTFTETERGVLPSARTPVAGESVPHPPLHPSCRCTLVADFGGAGEAIAPRGVDPTSGQPTYGPGTQLFDDLERAKTGADDPLRGYMLNYEEVNQSLRGLRAMDDQVRKIAQQVSGAIEGQRPLEQPIRLFRGVTKTDDFPLNLKSGELLHDPGIMSTSTDPGAIANFLAGDAVTMEIVVPRGARVFPSLRAFREIVLKPGTTLRFVGMRGETHMFEVVL